MKFPKHKAWRSQKHLKWVREQPCVICRAPATEAHHVIGVGNLGGMGTKAPDSYAIPVCRAHHDEIHRDPMLWSDQWEWLARTLAKALEEGTSK